MSPKSASLITLSREVSLFPHDLCFPESLGIFQACIHMTTCIYARYNSSITENPFSLSNLILALNYIANSLNLPFQASVSILFIHNRDNNFAFFRENWYDLNEIFIVKLLASA